MPDTPFYPGLNIDLAQLAIDNQKPALPDYGIEQTVQNIGDLYSQIKILKSENPLLKTAQGGMKTQEDFMFPSIKAAMSPKTRTSDIAPAQFDPVSESLDRYRQSSHFKDLGFIPGRNNEELYGRAQSSWEAITNGVKQAWGLGKFQFVDQLKGWGRMVDSVFSADMDKLFDQGDIDHVNTEMDRIMNQNPVFMTENDQNHVFTWKNFASTIGQTGFTLGAVSEIASEELLLSALTATTLGGAGELQVARTASLAGSLKRAFRVLGRVDEVIYDGSRMRKAFSKISEFTPLSQSIGTLVRGAKVDETGLQFAARGFGGFYRDLREANAAFTEARAETSGTYSQMKQDLTSQLYNSNQAVTQEKLDEIEKTSREAGRANFWANAAIIGISNRIEFDNIFRGFKGSARFLGESGQISFDAKGAFKRATMPFTKNYLRTLKAEAIPDFFRYFKNNITEALQENLQNVSNNSIQAYYKANYNNPGTGNIKNSIYDAISGELTTEGAKTFLSGFLVAALTSPLTRGVPALYNLATTSKAQRQSSKNSLQKQIDALNTLLIKPEARNAAVQFSISGAMGDAISKGDMKSFMDLKDESVRHFVRTAIETGKSDYLFDRIESIAKNLTKEEFEKAFGIEYSDPNKKNALSYIDSLRRRTESIQKVKDELDYQFPNPFQIPKKGEPEEMAKIAMNQVLFEEAKWHIASIQDAHQRTAERQGSLLRDMQDQMKDMSYNALYTLTDSKRATAEVKMLRQEAAVTSDTKVANDKRTRADLIEAMLPSIKEGKLDTKTFTEYVNHIQRADNRSPIEQRTIDENAQRISDFLSLSDDQNKMLHNLNWLADPKNFSSFVERHLQSEVWEKAKDTLDNEHLAEVRKAHPNYDISVVDSDAGLKVNISPKEGQLGSDEELSAIQKEAQSAANKAFGIEEGSSENDPNQKIKDRISEVYDKFAETGVIDPQDKDFLDQESVKKIGETNADYRKLQALLKQMPQQEEPSEEKGETPEEKVSKEELKKDDEDVPYYEDEPGTGTTPPPPGSLRTIIQEVKNGEKEGERDANGDVIMEGGYSFIRGTFARMLANFPHFSDTMDFQLELDNPAFYEHLRQMPKEVQDRLQIMQDIKSGGKTVKSPYKYFMDGNKSTGPIVTVRDRKTGDFVYFNPYVPGMITDSKNGVILAFGIDDKNVRDDVRKYLGSQPNQRMKLSAPSVSLGSFFDNGKKMRNYNEFFEGVDPEFSYDKTLHISRFLKYVEWNYPENTRNGGAFIEIGRLNPIKMVPSKLSELKNGNENYSIEPLFAASFTQNEAARVAEELSKIIYKGVFTPKNALAEKIIVSYEPSKTEKGKYILKLIRLVDSTPELPYEKKLFVNSGQNTETILNYLLKGDRRMNVMKEVNQDISLPYMDNGELKFHTMNYLDFASSNLFTNKARVVRPDGKLSIEPVNNFLAFPGLADTVKQNPAMVQAAETAAKKATGTQTPKKEGPVTTPEALVGNLWTTVAYKEKKDDENPKIHTLSDVVDKGNGVIEAWDSESKSRRTFNVANIEEVIRQNSKKPKTDQEKLDRLNAEKAVLLEGMELLKGNTEELEGAKKSLEEVERQIKELQGNKSEEKDIKSLMDKLRNQTKDKPSTELPSDPDELLPKVKDTVKRALVTNKEIQFIKDRFGEHVLNHVAYAVNSTYWGYWKNAVITLYSDAQRGVGYHEAWHHFSQMFLTKEEKTKLYNEAQSENPELRGQDFKKIEEYLADKFSQYAVNQEDKAPVRKNIFQKIWEFLKRLFKGETATSSDLDRYFKDLYSGELQSYKPSINNAMWKRLNYGFVVNREGKPVEIFDVREYNKAKGFFNVMLHNAFASDTLKAANLSMASLMSLRSNPALLEKNLQYVYSGVRDQILNYLSDNQELLSRNPAGYSLLERLVTNYNEFFNHMMNNLQIPSNVQDIVEQEDAETDPAVDISQVKSEDGEVEDTSTIEEVAPEAEEFQHSDRVLPFQDKGLLASVSKVIRNLVVMIPRANVSYTKEGDVDQVTPYKNEYGLPEPGDYNRIIAILGEELAGIFSDDEMVAKINSEELKQRLPEIVFLRDALLGYGPEKNKMSSQTVMSMMRDFNRVLVPVYSAIQLENGKIVMVEKTKSTYNKIRRNWTDGFRRSNLVDDLGRLKAEFAQEIPRSIPVEQRIQLLERLGITISPRTLRTRAFKELIASPGASYFLNSIRRRLEAGQKMENPIVETTRDFYYREEGDDQDQVIEGESQFIRNLIRVESIYSDVVPSNMFITSKGTKKYSLMLPTMFNVVGNALREAKSITELASKNHLHYLVDPNNYYMNNSLIMRSLFKGNEKRPGVEFEIGDYNGFEMKVFDKNINKQSFELTPKEKIIANMNTLLETGVIDLMRTGSSSSFYFYKVSDWHHIYEIGKNTYITVPSVKNVPFGPDFYTKGKPNANFWKAFRGYFFNLLVDEVSTMKLSGIEKVSRWGVFDEILNASTKAAIDRIEAENPDQIREKLAPMIDAISAQVEKYFFDSADPKSLTNKFLRHAKSWGITSTSDGRPSSDINSNIVSKYKASWRDLAANFVLNDFVLNVEYSRIISGTPQFYKDFHKRASGPVSPGNNLNIGSVVRNVLYNTHGTTMAGQLNRPFREIDTFNTKTTKDDFSDLDKDISDAWQHAGEVMGKEKEMSKVIAEYNQAKTKAKPLNDGQANCTLDFYRRARIQVGNWDFKTDEIEYNKEVIRWRIDNGMFKSEEEKALLQAYLDKFPKTLSTFPVMKLQYNGPQNAKGLMKPVFHKYAVAPIIPSSYKGTALEKAHEWMLKNDIDYIVAESGTKNYTSAPLDFWKDAVARNEVALEGETTPDNLFSVYLKEQIKTSSSIHADSTWGTQIRSLWLSNDFNNGKSTKEVEDLFKHYTSSINDMIESEKDQLFRDFGITEEGDNFRISNAEDFVKTLQAQVKIRDLNSNVQQAIGYDAITGGFTTPLEIVTNRQAIVDLIGGMVFKRLIRIKSNGDMLIQRSSSGTVREGEAELAFYKPRFDKNGKMLGTAPAECKLAFNPYFRPLLNLTHPDGKRIATLERLNDALKDKKWRKEHLREISIVGYRFPTEGINSMEYMAVKEFMPENFGSSLIVPREIVIKVGSDFDHDKVNIFRPNYSASGKVVGEEAKLIYSKALDRVMKLQKRNEVLSQLIQSIIDEGDDEIGETDDADWKEPIVLQNSNLSDEDKRTLQAFKEARRDLKGYYMNEVVSSYIKSLSSPEKFMDLIKPNTTENVKKLALDMAKRAGLEGFTTDYTGVKAFVNSQIFDYTNNHIKFMQNVQGRNDLAVFAVTNKILQNFQVAGVQFNPSFKSGYLKFSGGNKYTVFTNLNTTPHLLTKEERESFMEGGKLPMGNTTDIEGNTISHVVSELMNATVDIEKDAFYIGLGINNYNKGIAAMLLMMRVPLDRISAFLQQPILKEYYFRQATQPFWVNPDIEGATAVYATNINAREILGLKNRTELENFIAKHQNSEAPGVFDIENLLGSVGKTNWNTPAQKVVLAHFLALQRMQKVYMKLQKVITTDTKKIASPIGAKTYNANTEDIRSTGMITEDSLERLQKQSFTSPFKMADVLSKVFSTVMPLGFSETFTQAVADRIKASDLFITQDQMLKLERTVANDYMLYIVMSYGKVGEKSFREFVVSQLSKKVNPDTLMQRLLDLQGDPTYAPLFNFYSLTKSLNGNQSRRIKNLQNVELMRGADNSTEHQNVLIAEFQKLVNFTGREIPNVTYTAAQAEKIRTFFRDLAVVALGQSGFNKSLFYMTDILPLEEVQPIIKDAFKTYKNKMAQDPEFEKKFIDSFIKEFGMANPAFGLKGSVMTDLNREPWRGKYLTTSIQAKKAVGPQRRYIATKDMITREMVREDESILYVFGDNLLRTGLGGQAKEFRGEPNAIGIVTKRKPASDTKSFFSDSTLEENKKVITADVDKAINMFKTGGFEKMVVPPLGVGLARLDKVAPQTFAWLQEELKRLELAVNGGVVEENKPVATAQAAPASTEEDVPDGGDIVFKQDSETGYASRTKRNAAADVTIAIASLFDTAGEKLTRNAVTSQKKLYIPVKISDISKAAADTAQKIKALGKSSVSLNIAGNGIYTLKNANLSQTDVDKMTKEFIQKVVENLGDVKIKYIVTGGQTGFDEAGAKAGRDLGIPTKILAPRGWVFRDESGKDVADEKRFKARFTQPASTQKEAPAAPIPAPSKTTGIEAVRKLAKKEADRAFSMQPDNIEKIKSGTKTITNRTELFEDGTYVLSDGTKISVKLLGKAKADGPESSFVSFETVGDRGIAEDWDKDEFAVAEGFKDWEDFEKNNKFSNSFVRGVSSRYVYSVKVDTQDDQINDILKDKDQGCSE